MSHRVRFDPIVPHLTGAYHTGSLPCLGFLQQLFLFLIFFPPLLPQSRSTTEKKEKIAEHTAPLRRPVYAPRWSVFRTVRTVELLSTRASHWCDQKLDPANFISGQKSGSASIFAPRSSDTTCCAQPPQIMGDHIVFLLLDDVLPSTIGRGYVVRRLIRRAFRTSRLVGIKGDGRGNIEGTFLPTITEKVIDMSTDIDSEEKARAPRILEALKREELSFIQTLERGEKLLDQMLVDALSSVKGNGTTPCLSVKDAFLLYDTYGFPVEITKEEAGERGVTIDMNTFDVEMENHRHQSQAAHSAVKLEVGNDADPTGSISDMEFLGYGTLSSRAVVEGLLLNGKSVLQVSKGSEEEVLLNRTPFYAEPGGQIGDSRFVFIPEAGNREKAVAEIKDGKISLGNIFVHMGTVKEGSIEVGRAVEVAVDARLRQGAKVHHAAIHLLQAALKVIRKETSQAGSLVAFDRLRFDFNLYRPLSDNELMEIEDVINSWIADATLLQTKVMPLAYAKSAGAISMFGEKYGEQVPVL